MAQIKKVLVIDDDAAVCELIERTLKQQGFEVTTTQDARIGFEAAQRLHPDLIFLKLLLPGIDGLKVSKAIHAVDTLKTVPVIMNVAQQGDLDPRYTAAIGIKDILVIPLHPHEIIAKTKAVLGEGAFESSGMTVTPVFDEEDIEPVIVIDTYEEAGDVTLAPASGNGLHMPRQYGEHENSETPGPFGVTEDEQEKGLLPRELPFYQKEDMREERDLFSPVPASSGDDNDPEPEVHAIADDSSVDYDPVTEEVSPGPVRRGLLVGASVMVGIVLGVGGYLFFSAGNIQTPARKEVTKVLPDPATVEPSLPGDTAGKQNVIPEILVKQEPPVPGPAAHAESLRQKPTPAEVKTAARPAVPQKESLQKEIAEGDIPAGLYSVQAGVFESRANADALAEKIRKAGYAAFIKKVENSGKKSLYRVIAGTAASYDKAREMSESLRAKGFKTIVRRQ